jgi:hypothetical protein
VITVTDLPQLLTHWQRMRRIAHVMAGGHYWFELAAHVGLHWVGTRSAATAPALTIATSGTKCQ